MNFQAILKSSLRYHKAITRVSGSSFLILVLSLLLTAVALGSDNPTITLQDKCDPVSFATIGVPCIGNGDVTLTKFLIKLNPTDGGHGAWRFQPNDTHINVGQTLHVVNTGGEDHTFNEVLNFGTGIVPELNVALPPGTAAATPLTAPAFLPPGGTMDMNGLSLGTHKFQCLIHPWMRTTVEVRAR